MKIRIRGGGEGGGAKHGLSITIYNINFIVNILPLNPFNSDPPNATCLLYDDIFALI